ncbi:MAG TPA: hypothetical protein VFX49_13200 [Chloroflexota bacterium]|nr:hypothetical protein [Chloroflexota bacterium]
MASRLDAIQVAVPRAADNAAQQHAAQRVPVVAQEQATAANRAEAQARQERPEALQRRDGGEVKNDLIPPTREREAGGRTPRRRPQAPPAKPRKEPPPDGKGLTVDLRL